MSTQSVGKSDLNMNGISVRDTNPTPIHEDEVVPKQWIENHFMSRNSRVSTMARNLNMDGHNISYLSARTKSPRSDKRICRYEALAFGWRHARWNWNGWKQDFTLG